METSSTEKTKLLKELVINETFIGFYALRNCEKREHDGKPYLVLELGDSSGRMKATYWGDDAGAIFEGIRGVNIVKINGKVVEYKGEIEIKTTKIRPATPEEYDGQNLLPICKIPREILDAYLSDLLESIKEPFLRILLKRIFLNQILREKFLICPAGKLWHGAYIGGLAEHSINVAKICIHASNIFEMCRRDVIVAGAMLHDIGKIEELNIGSFLDYSIPGRLVGHTVIGERIVRNNINSIENFPQNLADEISHLILSHHGSADMGAPVLPQTLEAIILHNADLLESQANAVSHIIIKELPSGKPFSNWVRPLDRFIFIEGSRKKAE